MSSGIYEIRNMVNGYRYIGSAINLRARKTQHFNHLRKNIHHCSHLQRAFNLYGEENFIFTALYECQPEELTRCEQEELDVLKPEYNILPRAYSPQGIKRSEETKRKLSESKMGEKNPNYGKSPSEETRAKLAISSSKIVHTEETKRKIAEWHMGKTPSDETRKKISDNKKIAYVGSGNPNYGKHLSEEARKKLSECVKMGLEKRRINAQSN